MPYKTSHSPVFQSGLYGNTPLEPTTAEQASRYVSHAGVQKLLDRACVKLGVTPHHLAQLLGCSSSRQVYSWTGGHTRPSAKYMARLALLLMEGMEGKPVATWRSVDWNSGEMEQRRNEKKVKAIPNVGPRSEARIRELNANGPLKEQT